MLYEHPNGWLLENIGENTTVSGLLTHVMTRNKSENSFFHTYRFWKIEGINQQAKKMTQVLSQPSRICGEPYAIY